MFCKGCGKAIDSAERICPYCGRRADALSGGTGFWDLIEGIPESQVRESARKEPATELAVKEERVTSRQEIEEALASNVRTMVIPGPNDRRMVVAIRLFGLVVIILVIVLIVAFAGRCASSQDVNADIDGVVSSEDGDFVAGSEEESGNPEGEKRVDDGQNGGARSFPRGGETWASFGSTQMAYEKEGIGQWQVITR